MCGPRARRQVAAGCPDGGRRPWSSPTTRPRTPRWYRPQLPVPPQLLRAATSVRFVSCSLLLGVAGGGCSTPGGAAPGGTPQTEGRGPPPPRGATPPNGTRSPRSPVCAPGGLRVRRFRICPGGQVAPGAAAAGRRGEVVRPPRRDLARRAVPAPAEAATAEAATSDQVVDLAFVHVLLELRERRRGVGAVE